MLETSLMDVTEYYIGIIHSPLYYTPSYVQHNYNDFPKTTSALAIETSLALEN